ncbi:flagellar basal-body rod protein FlgF [Microvirga thermotolerans]|uniref:Flagellar basal-body rod protein FlgF n=1 Tax=Microvirga thermotolerans TaxID=2651334 RepID=A0A5P9K159_9HYPH|nr:flagellar basal-body rod protein FlgF [Microvirga thermotolerans]QFU17656.1 flagellar basal-body rod protein FlgF [Microvirga thermotolerans]
MQSSLYVALSAQVALEKRLNTVANNIANINTGGYRAEEVKFETVLSQAGLGGVAFASSGETYTSRRPGAVTRTDNPLDVAIQGDAWLSVSTPSGIVYTRDGRMKMSETGELQTMDGYAVLDPGGAPILLNPQDGEPTIGRDGMIHQRNNQIGALGLFKLDSRSQLTRYGSSGVKSSLPATVVQDFTAVSVQRGYAEGSNVNPVMELTKLIMISRTFDNAAAAVSETESSLMSAIRTLGPGT